LGSGLDLAEVQRFVSDSKPVKIPFDSFALSAVVREVQPFVGGKIQDIRQPNDYDVCIGVYAGGREGMLLLSCHPEFARSHFITKRRSNQAKPPVFCSTLRSRLEGARLTAATQVQEDRVLDLTFESPVGAFRLVAELMGKHSNLIFMDDSNRILSAAKWVGRGKSSRPIQPNSHYELPPVMTLGAVGRRSPFLTKLLAANGADAPGPISPVLSPGHGAYPVSVAALGLIEFPRVSVSVALEQHFDLAIPQVAADSLRSSLLAQLRRLVLAKEVALADLRQAEEAGGKASGWQRMGELVLAYGAALPEASSELPAWDYDGTEVRIKLDPELDFKANASRYFERAKRAKGRLGIVRDQIARIGADHENLLGMIAEVELESKLGRLQELEQQSRDRRWINQQVVPAARKEDRPYEGHRIRELIGPGGLTVLYGENAESNDFLTLRVAKPNDYWLHVRGGTSAHVVIATRNQPERVQPETLRFAAKIAVLNSTSKHAGYVPVDYTLKKYVRRQKGAAKGSAIYTHEKTIHVETEG
jgi:predicted ribosome quality control (RQC) complex YloA/Tae2 family protein